MNYKQLAKQYCQHRPKKVVVNRSDLKRFRFKDLIKIEMLFGESDQEIRGYSVKLDELPVEMTALDKGDLGELVGILMKALDGGGYGRVTERGAPHDYDLEDIRIDFKIASPSKSRYPYWKFYVGGKDYTKSCTHLCLMGIRPNGTVEMYLIPTDSPEMRNNRSDIKIFLNGKRSQWTKYKVESKLAVDPKVMAFMKHSQSVRKSVTELAANLARETEIFAKPLPVVNLETGYQYNLLPICRDLADRMQQMAL